MRAIDVHLIKGNVLTYLFPSLTLASLNSNSSKWYSTVIRGQRKVYCNENAFRSFVVTFKATLTIRSANWSNKRAVGYTYFMNSHRPIFYSPYGL